MFDWLKNKKVNENKKDEGTEYSFIWYKEMQVGGTTHYAQPFRTKVKAQSFAEAEEKIKNFALNKMKLVIVSEEGFDKTDLSKFHQGFEEMNKHMNEVFGKLKF